MFQQKVGDQIPSGGNYLSHKEKVTLTNCDREPIHIPGSIQPHGYLLAFSETGNILHLSRNVSEWQGLEVEQLLGKPLSELLGSAAAHQVNSLPEGPGTQKRFLTLSIKCKDKLGNYGALLHRKGTLNILELEPQTGQEALHVDLELLNNSMQAIQESQSPEAMARIVTEEIQQLLGFDRVMVYRFKEDWSGEVIAETKSAAADSFLGLHFPATDIPVQARALYREKPIRLIPDADYQPVPILPEINPQSGQPLDLSLASLRSVSPIHIQYLKNMGVKASMSVSVIKGGRLWGLIACHHKGACFVSYQKRQLCELLARAFAMVLGEKEELRSRSYHQQIKETKANLVRNISKAEKFTDGLHKQQPDVQELIRCGGCVISLGEEYISLGKTPAREQVKELLKWLQKEGHEEVFYTHTLPVLYKPAEQFRETGSGILALAVSRVQQEYIIWFRPELRHSVRWAGKKEEPGGEEGVLSPRKSFEAWVEQVHEQAEPWLPLEVEVARELRTVLVDVVLRISGELKLRADILSRINQELDTSKNELDSFAYIVSHDLKEPLRGINNYAAFLLEDYKDQLQADGQAKLRTLMRLSKRMQQLIDSLLHFSRLGRLELQRETVDMGKVLAGVMDIFGQQIANEKVQVQLPEQWPLISCDELRVSEVWMNLLSNALKYNDKAVKELNLGYRKAREGEPSPSGYVFYVRDNGIGIDASHYEDVFNIFRRLHGREAFGGGTGAGLTIVKKIVERHEGTVWLESKPGKGTTFCFSL